MLVSNLMNPCTAHLSLHHFLLILIAEGVLIFYSNEPNNNMWGLRCMHWQKGNTGCKEENLVLLLYTKYNSTSVDLAEQQNYLTQLGFNQDKFEIIEALTGRWRTKTIR